MEKTKGLLKKNMQIDSRKIEPQMDGQHRSQLWSDFRSGKYGVKLDDLCSSCGDTQYRALFVFETDDGIGYAVSRTQGETTSFSVILDHVIHCPADLELAVSFMEERQWYKKDADVIQ